MFGSGTGIEYESEKNPNPFNEETADTRNSNSSQISALFMEKLCKNGLSARSWSAECLDVNKICEPFVKAYQ